jgi:hypothetical protein
MAVGDSVVGAFVDINDPVEPLIGIVNAEPGGTDADVLWRNLNRATVPQADLLKVFPGNAIGQSMIGKWVQLMVFPETEDTPGGPPKSPATAGLVIDCYGTAEYGALAATVFWVIFTTEDGRGIMQVPAVEFGSDENTIIVQARRNV